MENKPTLFDLLERAARQSAVAVGQAINDGKFREAAELLQAATNAADTLQRAALDWGQEEGEM